MLLSLMSWEPEAKTTSRFLVPNVKVFTIQMSARMESSLKQVAKAHAVAISQAAAKTLTTNHKVLR